ncbi:MAG: hypothetical protein ABMB14_06930 [Myxococcota bacterium]
MKEAFNLLGGSDLDDFEAVWGMPAPAELAALTHAFAGQTRDLYEWRWSSGALANPPADRNLFELLVVRDQADYLGTRLYQAFAGLHLIGYQGNGAPNTEIAAVDADRVRSILALGGCTGEVELALELTYDEFTAVEARAADPDLAACVEAAVWGTAIPPGTFAEPRAAGVVSVRTAPE